MLIFLPKLKNLIYDVVCGSEGGSFLSSDDAITDSRGGTDASLKVREPERLKGASVSFLPGAAPGGRG